MRKRIEWWRWVLAFLVLVIVAGAQPFVDWLHTL